MPLTVRLSDDKASMGAAAAAYTADAIRKAVDTRGKARIIIATGASQFDFLENLTKIPDMPWDKVTAFHLDEYVGIPADHPAAFRRFLQERFFSLVKPSLAAVHLVEPTAEGMEAYGKLLLEDDIDIACIGIGENGHIAFNDPPVADFEDAVQVKQVELDEACRRQQVGEGWFPTVEDTPRYAATLTVPAIMRAKIISVVTPDARKAAAVRDTLGGPIATSCPASVMRRHDNTVLWLDNGSAAETSESVLADYEVTDLRTDKASGGAGGAGGGSAEA